MGQGFLPICKEDMEKCGWTQLDFVYVSGDAYVDHPSFGPAIITRILESYGYMMCAPRGGSSHYTFRKPGCRPITVPKHEPIKRVYVEMVRQVIESEENHENVE